MTIDPILTNVNAAADRRLMDDVLNAPDPFDGGCPADCGGDFGGHSGGDCGGKPVKAAKPAADFPTDGLEGTDAHTIRMMGAAFELAWRRALNSVMDRIPYDVFAKACASDVVQAEVRKYQCQTAASFRQINERFGRKA